MDPAIEVWICEARRRNPDWGPRRLVHEAVRAGLHPMPSRSGVYRALKRAGLIDQEARRHRDRRFKRWERGGAMELWQMDVVGGVLLGDGRQCKVLTGIDDHSLGTANNRWRILRMNGKALVGSAGPGEDRNPQGPRFGQGRPGNPWPMDASPPTGPDVARSRNGRFPRAATVDMRHASIAPTNEGCLCAPSSTTSSCASESAQP